MIVPGVSQGELIDDGALFFEQLQDGLEKYPYDILRGDFTDFYTFLMLAYEWNTQEKTYADFYYNSLDKEQKELLQEQLGEPSRLYLVSHEFESKSLYYRLDPELLGVLLEISYRELLFSTFYFNQFPCAVWANYGGVFPIFYRDKFIQKLYRKTLKDNTGIILGE